MGVQCISLAVNIGAATPPSPSPWKGEGNKY